MESSTFKYSKPGLERREEQAKERYKLLCKECKKRFKEAKKLQKKLAAGQWAVFIKCVSCFKKEYPSVLGE